MKTHRKVPWTGATRNLLLGLLEIGAAILLAVGCITQTRDGSSEGGGGLNGIVRVRDSFEFHYQATLPELTGPARLWLPLPETDPFQTIEVKALDVPGESRVIRDRDYGNRILFVELGPDDGWKTITMDFEVVRREKTAYESSAPEGGPDPSADRVGAAHEPVLALARHVTADKKTDQERAWALFDHVVALRGEADAIYFIALARAAGIPARFAAGASIPSGPGEGGIDDLKGWAEFYADGKWQPVDVSEAGSHPGLAAYCFNHHSANRFELSRGQDLVVFPLPGSGPIRVLAYPVLEVAGRPVRPEVALSFRRTEVSRLVNLIMRNAVGMVAP